MKERMVAYCGIVCSDCPAYIATQNGDKKLLTETAKKWSSSSWEVKPEDIVCDGCVQGKRLAKFCYECPTRNCGVTRKVKNCGWCDDYPCETLKGHWERFKIPEQQTILDEEHRQKRATKGKGG